MTTVLGQVVDARLLGVTGGDLVGLPHNNGECYAFLSPLTKTVVIVDLRDPGTPLIAGSLELPGIPDSITVDYATGMVVYVAGSGKLWEIALDGNFAPTLTAERDCPTLGIGGLTMVDESAGSYVATYGPFMVGALTVPHPTESVLYVHDAARQLLHVYSGDDEPPYLTLQDSIETPGAQETKALRIGPSATHRQLFIVTSDFIHTYQIDTALAPEFVSSVRHRESKLTDIVAIEDTVNAAYLQHIGGKPPIDGQTGAPLYIDDEDFVTAIPVSAGILFIVANKDLGKVTVWR